MTSRGTRLRSAIAVILTILVLVPTGFLFVRIWQDNATDLDNTKLEKQGVEYLGALLPLVSALAEFQSSVLQGVAKPPDSLQPAVDQVAAVDGRLGETLKTTQRWASLQDKIGKLATPKGTPVEILQAHVEVSDLTLALFNTTRRNSKLNRDPDNDISSLQQAIAVDMPTAVTVVSQEGDLANLLPNVTGPTRTTIGALLGQSVLGVQDAVTSLTDNLQSAVDETSNPELSGSLVSSLDAFRRGIESMNRGANIGGAPNAATMSTAQITLQTALSSLAGITLREMTRLLDDREDTLTYRRAEAAGMSLLILLLVIGALLLQTLGRRRRTGPGEPAGPAHDGQRNPPPGGTAYGGNPYDQPYDQAPAYGEDDPTRRERFGALR